MVVVPRDSKLTPFCNTLYSEYHVIISGSSTMISEMSLVSTNGEPDTDHVIGQLHYVSHLRGLILGRHTLPRVQFPWDYNVTQRFPRLYAVQLMNTMINMV